MYCGHGMNFTRYCGCCGVVGDIIVVANTSVVVCGLSCDFGVGLGVSFLWLHCVVIVESSV